MSSSKPDSLVTGPEHAAEERRHASRTERLMLRSERVLRLRIKTGVRTGVVAPLGVGGSAGTGCETINFGG